MNFLREMLGNFHTAMFGARRRGNCDFFGLVGGVGGTEGTILDRLCFGVHECRFERDFGWNQAKVELWRGLKWRGNF